MAEQDSLPRRISTHGIEAVGATLLEVRRDGETIGKVRRMAGRHLWELQPDGWDGWTAGWRLMQEAVDNLDYFTDETRVDYGTP